MNVEETKKLILRRLSELREAAPGEEQRQAAMAPSPRTAPRNRRGRWFAREGERGARGNIEGRLSKLEERLAAVERCFVHASRAGRVGSAGGPQRLGQHGPSGSLPPPAQPEHSSAQPAQQDATTTEKHGFDFGGEPYRLTGDVNDGLITDVLQMLTSNQKTGRFSLFMPQRDQRFDLIFDEGEVVHAEAGELEGESAFFSLMLAAHQEGYYGFLEGERTETKKTIEAKTQFLILEALRRIDEESGDDDKAAETT